MPRGRPPKPVELHIKEGTLTCRQKARVPLLIGGRGNSLPLPPDYLSDEAKEAYKFLIDNLWEAGILDRIDIPLVIEAAILYSRAVSAAVEIKTHGLFIETIRGARGKKGVKVKVLNPALSLERESWAKFNQVADRLGIGASARASLGAKGIKGKSPQKELKGLEEFKLKIIKGNDGRRSCS